ncbi:DUF3500 domain-containing protein [Paraglaciecola aquimarina]|uniref:DUF3500 domain-containing protein n=1 Tax=Paraglaciecola algarum TaxID=3050085 RepID=A0ABS9DAQ2_9ALTE|nr:DUF3500 domain-containing protein [Paraglaciecola sp. G1-23]MCF2949993.1 DUF3500 domain-containing protein [Paraglaciecola sp. G1-23]
MLHRAIFLLSLTLTHISLSVTASELTNNTVNFVNSLDPQQASLVLFKFKDEERFNWKFVPTARKGLPLKELNAQQKQLAIIVLKSSLSEQGFNKATSIIDLEEVLKVLNNEAYRDTELYYLSIFGQPQNDNIWAWRFEGHHLSLNFTVEQGKLAAVTPNFWGANPANVPSGDKQGLRVLKLEEDLARELINNLSAEQQKQAIISNKAYRDILTRNQQQVSPLANKGILFSALNSEQKAQLLGIISVYLNNMPKDLAQSRYQQIQSHSINNLQFAWAGSIKVNQKHYYRIQGDSFLIEYDNVQNNGNHIHTVWRDFKGDFGRDLLQEHHTKHKH